MYLDGPLVDSVLDVNRGPRDSVALRLYAFLEVKEESLASPLLPVA